MSSKYLSFIELFLFRFNGQAQLGIQALEDIHSRSSYELYADVLLVSQLYNTTKKVNNAGR